MMTISKSEANAINRAVQLRLAARVQRVRCGEYHVPSATCGGAIYTVRVEATAYTCDCPAGIHGRPCKHMAAVLIAKVEHVSRCHVTGPAHAPAHDQANTSEVTDTAIQAQPLPRSTATLRINGREYQGTGETLLDALAHAQPVQPVHQIQAAA